jgi:CspA family cold shock protein
MSLHDHLLKSHATDFGALGSFSFSSSYSRMAMPLGISKQPDLSKEKTMPIGTVKFFNADKGYGFIQPEGGGNDAFVHITAVEAAGMRTLDRDQRVSYELEEDRRGKTSAVNLTSA